MRHWTISCRKLKSRLRCKPGVLDKALLRNRYVTQNGRPATRPVIIEVRGEITFSCGDCVHDAFGSVDRLSKHLHGRGTVGNSRLTLAATPACVCTFCTRLALACFSYPLRLALACFSYPLRAKMLCNTQLRPIAHSRRWRWRSSIRAAN